MPIPDRHQCTWLIRSVFAAMALIAMGCEHSKPFQIAGIPPDEAFDPRPPVRLTYSPGCDVLGVPSRDGAFVTYDFLVDEVASEFPFVCPFGDRCLAVLPTDGGRRREVICHPRHPRRDTVHAAFAAAIRDDGALLYAQTARFIGSPVVTSGAIMLKLPGAAARPILPMLTLFPEADSKALRHLHRIWWLRDNEALVTDSSGVLILTLNGGARAAVRALEGVRGNPSPAVDPESRRVLWYANSNLMIVPIDGGAAEVFSPLPLPTGWVHRRVTGLGFRGNTALVAQIGFTVAPEDGEVGLIAQLLQIPRDGQARVLASSFGRELFGASAILPSGRAAIVEHVDVMDGTPPPIDLNLVRYDLLP